VLHYLDLFADDENVLPVVRVSMWSVPVETSRISVPGRSGHAVSSAGNPGRPSAVNFPTPSAFSYMVRITD
jgi:hypothetical protein